MEDLKKINNTDLLNALLILEGEKLANEATTARAVNYKLEELREEAAIRHLPTEKEAFKKRILDIKKNIFEANQEEEGGDVSLLANTLMELEGVYVAVFNGDLDELDRESEENGIF